MIKVLYKPFSLAIVMLFLVAACGGGASPTAVPTAPVAGTTPTAAPAGTGSVPTAIPDQDFAGMASQTAYSQERLKELIAEGFWVGGLQYGAGLEPKMGGTLTFSNRGDLPGADPMLAAGISSNNVLSSIHGEGSLVRPARENVFEPVPHIAESWTATEDFKVWTFKLRKDVEWHDGTTLVAEDLKFWIDLAYFPPAGRKTAYIGTFGPLQEVQVVDDYTLQLVMKQGAPFLLEELMNNAAAPTHPRHILKPMLASNALISMQDANWVSVGPFKFEAYNKGSSFKAIRFDQYFEKDDKGRTLPYLDSIFYPFISDRTVAVSAFRAGWIDGTSRGTGHHLTPDHVENIKKSLGDEAWFLRLSYLSWGAGLNATKPPFDDINVRKALSLYTDRQEGIKLVYGGYALGGTIMVPDSYWSDPSFRTWPGFNPATKAQDQAEAKRTLKETGYEGTSLNVTCRDFYLPNCEFMEVMLRGLGFNPRLDVMDMNRQTTLLQSGNFQIDMRPSGAPSPSRMLTGFTTTNPLNTHKHGDKKVDEYADLLDTTIDQAQRRKLTWEADKYVILDKAYYPHWYWEEAIVSYRTYVKGMRIPGEQIQHNNEMATVWIDTSLK